MIKGKKLIIVGIGETALIAYEYFQFDSEYEVVAFSVSKAYLKTDIFNNKPLVAFENIKNSYPPEGYEVYIAISSGKLNRHRTQMYEEAKDKGYTCATYVSSRAFVWHNVKLGDNCFIFENNALQPFVEIGNNVTIWSGNHIGHRTIIKDNCFVSSHCVISGFCEIGKSSFLGVNCTIEDNILIGTDNFIGAGAIIRKNTEDNCLYQPESTSVSKVTSHRLFRIKAQE